MWETFGNLANAIQIVSAIPFFWGAYLLFSRARRYKKATKKVSQTISSKPMALVISLSGTDVTAQVRDFLDKNILKGIEIRSFYKKEGVTSGNIPHFLSEILKLKSEMTADGVTEVHLFLMVPVAFAAAIGAILDNWVYVKVYHLNHEKNTYEYWTYLHKGFVPGLDYSIIKEMSTE